MPFNIRLIGQEDVEDVLGLMLMAQDGSPYKDLPVDLDQLKSNISSWVNGTGGTWCILAKEEGTDCSAGLLLFNVTSQNQIMPGIKISAELLFYVDEPYRSTSAAKDLKKAYELNASEVLCDMVSMGSHSNEYAPRLDKWYTKSGYTVAETQYIKKVI